MSQIEQFQSLFKELMLDEPEALANPPDALRAMLVGADAHLQERLNVYRTNIIGGLSDVIIESFPVVKALVGEAFLKQIARGFVINHPPKAGYLHYYGEGFAEYVEKYNEARSLPYLPDIARLESAMNRCHYAKTLAALKAEELSNMGPEDLGDLRLRLQEHVQLISSRYPLIEIHDFVKSDGEGDAPNIDDGGGDFMIYKGPTGVELALLGNGDASMLRGIQDGVPLGKALENTLNADSAFDIQAFLTLHIHRKTFVSPDIPIDNS